MIFDCIKELFMHVFAICVACFFMAKINKKLWPPTFKFDPPTLNALAPALKWGKCFNLITNFCTSVGGQ